MTTNALHGSPRALFVISLAAHTPFSSAGTLVADEKRKKGG